MTQTGPGMGRVALFDIHSVLCIVTATSPGLALVLALFELSNNEHLNQNQHWNLTGAPAPGAPRKVEAGGRRRPGGGLWGVDQLGKPGRIFQ